MSDSDLLKPEVNEIAAIIFSELYNNEGMTIVGKVEKAIPRIEDYIHTRERALLERIRNELKDKVFEAGYNNGLIDMVSGYDVAAILTKYEKEMK